MEDILPLLPLPGPPRGKSAYYVPCPKCDRDGWHKDKHLNINLLKDVFRCARCGWNGGIFDLYAYYMDVPRESVREELKRVLNKNGAESWKKPSDNIAGHIPPEAASSSAADINTRHAVYSALLSLLSLAPDHKRNLLGRGLSEQAIIKNEYRTTPVVGGRALAKQIQGMGYRLTGVPGFYKDDVGQWTFVAMRRGILVPVRDIQCRIQGLQVRRDNMEKRKYRWVSSAGIKGGANGCGAEGWVHLAGPVRDRILLIEGPLKADVVYHLTGQSVIAVPGVNSLKHLEATLAELVDLGARRVMIAFDMDFLYNPHIQNGYGELASLLGRLDLRFGTYLWRPDYNGLDDYIWEYCLGSSNGNIS